MTNLKLLKLLEYGFPASKNLAIVEKAPRKLHQSIPLLRVYPGCMVTDTFAGDSTLKVDVVEATLDGIY